MAESTKPEQSRPCTLSYSTCEYFIENPCVCKIDGRHCSSLERQYIQFPARLEDSKIIDLQPAIGAKEKLDRAKQYAKISHKADHLLPYE